MRCFAPVCNLDHLTSIRTKIYECFKQYGNVKTHQTTNHEPKPKNSVCTQKPFLVGSAQRRLT